MLITFSWSCHRSSRDISSKGFFDRVAASGGCRSLPDAASVRQVVSVYCCLSELRLTATGNGCVCTITGASAVVGAGSTSVLRFLPLRLAGAGSNSAMASVVVASSVVVLFFGGLPRLAWQAVARLLPSCCAGSRGQGLLLLLLLRPAARLPVRDSSMWNQTSNHLLRCCGYIGSAVFAAPVVLVLLLVLLLPFCSGLFIC